MKTGVYTLKSFLSDHNLEQIIIPEIQRDYVWQKENVVSLLNSIKLNAERETTLTMGASEKMLDSLNPELRAILLKELEKNKNYCNVGFIYAYYDIDLPGKFMLIDGQQRLTTLFLLLLCLSIKENKHESFRRMYFKDGTLKLDYKVRENAHNFMYRFVNHLLDGNTTDSVSDQFWYFSEYRMDATINSLLQNYITIHDFLDTSNVTLSYVEDYIEFWYFDTKESKQGEELYIYMNSRGESVSSGESLKAELLNGLSAKDKHDWGTKWEEWQNFFWINKGVNSNADKGMEEFIRWITVIETIITSQSSVVAQLEQRIRGIRDKSKISSTGLSFPLIESYFEALQRLVLNKKKLNFNDAWMSGTFPAIDYIKLLPALYFAKAYPDASDIELKRVARYYFNITRFVSIAKNPIESLVSALLLIKSFLKSGQMDIAEVVNLPDINSFDTLLTLEEQQKFNIYNKIPEDFRFQVEKVFWMAEDNRLLEGRISFIWKCMTFNPNNNYIDLTTLSDFKTVYSHFCELFDNVDDHVRRSLLSKGDYSIWHGRTATLSGERYSFISSDMNWRSQLQDDKKMRPYVALIKDYTLRTKNSINPVKQKILEEIITEFHNKTTKKDWIYYFVKYPSILDYCRKKLVCFQDAETDLDKIVLLQSQNAGDHNWKWLKDVIANEI